MLRIYICIYIHIHIYIYIYIYIYINIHVYVSFLKLCKYGAVIYIDSRGPGNFVFSLSVCIVCL